MSPTMATHKSPRPRVFGLWEGSVHLFHTLLVSTVYIHTVSEDRVPYGLTLNTFVFSF